MRHKEYYLDMAMEICRKLNARNSDVYMRCLLLKGFHPQKEKFKVPTF